MNLEATDEDIEEEMVDEMEKEEELAHSLHLCVERIRIPVFRVREQVALQVMVNLATMAVCLPLCRLLRRPQAPTHVLQRRHTRAIINRPKPRLQIAMSILQPLPVYKDHHGSCRELIPTDSAMVEADRPYAKEPNASYMARQTCDYDAMEELHY
ncbi:hypothetical protein KXW98_000097 [Aspergillus fumigatus]|uniref:Uncharacterized protein n=1 Tax=Aspergillus fumigatus TaxID=746128 RepID=A0A9P8NC16_ASPFM|nr:hypothetical protein KXX45_000337 [Aspergillus fumigatus]KAH1299434.1 hypothetical protein KXX30_000149 [Aspergillus fumigatus]KAH1301184.1 hypothetical protein KXX11_004290 [Aspergillus fumigatus]KAH1323071.1 hypothetical protein KXX66_008559 [Aspergillus fumigatus]KAH1342841.1 hypothetical protein KXX67_006048 [Aspergillus fumigatus]